MLQIYIILRNIAHIGFAILDLTQNDCVLRPNFLQELL